MTSAATAPKRERGQAERRALAELARRRQGRGAVDFRALCFGAQRAFVEDTALLVAASCSRRAGKTWGIAYKLLSSAQAHPWSTCLYLTNTRPQAKRIVWPVLQRLDADLGLKGKFNQVELSYRLPNGAQILLGGCNDEVEIERYRGAAYPVVVIDEAQSVRAFLQRLIEEILEPATLDYRGQIYLTGTPNAAGIGYFRDVAVGAAKGWSVHRWTLLDNPEIPHAAQWLADMRARRGMLETDPKYRREYLGEWVRDSSSQVYQIDDRNLVAEWPQSSADDWEYVLGVDIGFVGVSAFVTLAYSEKAARIVVLESHQVTPPDLDASMLTPQLLAVEIGKLRARYDYRKIVVDPGGLGAKFIDELRTRFAVPAQAAEKHAKMGAIELLNGDLRTGRVLVVEPKNRDLIHDARMLEWRWDRVSEEDVKRGTVDRSDLVIDDRTPDHLTDALTYAYRACRAYMPEEVMPEARLRVGSLEWEEREERDREARQMEAARESEARPWWAQDPDDTDEVWT